MTGSLGANAVWSSEGADPAVNMRKPVSRQLTPRHWAAVRVRTLRTVGLALSWEDKLLGRDLGEGVRNEGQDRQFSPTTVAPRSQEQG